MKFAWAEYISFYTIVSNYNGSLSADIARINDGRHINRCRNRDLPHSRSWSVSGCCVYYRWHIRGWSFISSIGISRWDLITKTIASTNKSYNKGKKPVLAMDLDLFMDEYRCGILATDDMTEVGVYISFIWIYRRSLCTATSYTTCISHNHKLQMRTDDAFDDLFETE